LRLEQHGVARSSEHELQEQEALVLLESYTANGNGEKNEKQEF